MGVRTRALLSCVVTTAAILASASGASAQSVIDEDSGLLGATSRCAANATRPAVTMVSNGTPQVRSQTTASIACTYKQYRPDIQVRGWLTGYVGGAPADSSVGSHYCYDVNNCSFPVTRYTTPFIACNSSVRFRIVGHANGSYRNSRGQTISVATADSPAATGTVNHHCFGNTLIGDTYVVSLDAGSL